MIEYYNSTKYNFRKENQNHLIYLKFEPNSISWHIDKVKTNKEFSSLRSVWLGTVDKVGTKIIASYKDIFIPELIYLH